MPSLTRTARNIGLMPVRAVRSGLRRLSPGYRYEREAKALVAWFDPAHLARLESIPGMCSTRECRLIALFAVRAPAGGAIVEIGAWKGRVTAWLVEAAERRAERPAIFSIDPHRRGSWDDFQRTVQDFQLAERGLRVMRQDSAEAGPGWAEAISLLWIDGSHEYPDVARDIALFTPHVIGGGLVAFDDSVGGAFPGVERAIAEWIAAGAAFRPVATVRNVSVFVRAA